MEYKLVYKDQVDGLVTGTFNEGKNFKTGKLVQGKYFNRFSFTEQVNGHWNFLLPIDIEAIRDCLELLIKKTQTICRNCSGSGSVVDYFNGEPMKYCDKKTCIICSGSGIVILERNLNSKARTLLASLPKEETP
jgi:DnaJ-class molecular chaperone